MNRFGGLAASLVMAVALCAGAASAEPPAIRSIPGWVRPRLVGAASDSGRFSLDEQKLRALFPDFEWTADQLAYLDEHLQLGDSRAAIVASVDPLVVSAYSDELDGVILVNFPDHLVKHYSLAVGDLLIASWVYPRSPQAPRDIVQGDHNLGRYNNGAPIVADFFSNSQDKIKKRKEGVSSAEWDRVLALTPLALKRADGKYRTCFPLYAGVPPERLEASAVEK
jgi:hypothetical protein